MNKDNLQITNSRRMDDITDYLINLDNSLKQMERELSRSMDIMDDKINDVKKYQKICSDILSDYNNHLAKIADNLCLSINEILDSIIDIQRNQKIILKKLEVIQKDIKEIKRPFYIKFIDWVKNLF